MTVNDLLKLANDHLVMAPIDALATACAIASSDPTAPRWIEGEGESLMRTLEWQGKAFPVSYHEEDGEWRQGWI